MFDFFKIKREKMTASPLLAGPLLRKWSGTAISSSRPYFLVLMATLVALAIFWKSHAFPPAYRWTIVSCVLLLCLYSFVALSRIEEPTPVLRWSVLSALCVGVMFLLSMPLGMVRTVTSTVTLSNHLKAPDSQAKPVDIWGTVVDAYTLHPVFADATTANALAITLLPEPTFGTLLITQPNSSLQNDDGTLTEGDGIGLTVKTFDKHGEVNGNYDFALSQADFLKRKWIKIPLWSNAIVTRLELTVDSGPVGSTPNHDTTLVGFHVTNFANYFQKLSTVVLLTLSAFSLIFAGGCVVRRMLPQKSSRHAQVKFFSQLAVVSLVSAGYVYWQQTHSNFAYYWDYLNYWAKTEAVFHEMQAAQWANLFDGFIASLSENYSAVPALPMALLAWMTGAFDQISYALILNQIYTVPTYVILVFLARKIATTGNEFPKSSAFRWDVSILSLILTFPSYFGTTLLLMPDIGGVFIVALAIIFANDAVTYVSGSTSPESLRIGSSKLISVGLTLGALIAFSFLFRRWYIFAAVGILGAMGCLLLIHFLRHGHRRRSIFALSTKLLTTLVFSAISLLWWTLLSWGAKVDAHDYATLYASYDFGLLYTAEKLVQTLGAVPIVISVAGLLVGLRSKMTNALVWILIISAIISAALFLSIQTPGRHHFYLLMPSLSVGFLLAFWTAVDRWGRWIVGAMIAVLIVGGILTPRPFGVRIFPEYGDMLPKQQRYVEEFKDMAKWLDSAEIRELPFCVIASSSEINQSIFANLWQIYPTLDRQSFPSRLVPISEVDSIHGPPSASIKDCSIFLVADPFQYHLSRSSQFNVEVLQRELLNGGGLGDDVDRVPVHEWVLGREVRMVAYKRIRPTSDAGYRALVERYRNGKALDSGGK